MIMLIIIAKLPTSLVTVCQTSLKRQIISTRKEEEITMNVVVRAKNITQAVAMIKKRYSSSKYRVASVQIEAELERRPTR